MMKDRTKKNARFSRLIAMLLLIFIIPAAFLYWGNNSIDTEELTVKFPNLPASFDGFRIAVLSDLHGKQFGENNSALISAVSGARPDIIAITGDLADEVSQFTSASALVSKLSKIAPVYYVTGNHEWATRSVPELVGLLKACGARVLQNDFLPITLFKGTIILAGADDPNGPYDMISPKELLDDIRASFKDPFIVLLSHRNNRSDKYAEAGADLVLSGHAHGGIIRLPFTDGLIGPANEWFPDYTNGIYTIGQTTMVVSRGLGNNRDTFRLFNRPHLPVVILKA